MANTESAAPAIKLFGKTITRTDDKRPIVVSPSPELAAEDGTTRAEAATAAAVRAVLACPRCKSRETKFCYFNNYNVNQPRHFCRSCRRHWTAGGTQRNVPAGAGRRKNLRPSSPSEPAAPEETSR